MDTDSDLHYSYADGDCLYGSDSPLTTSDHPVFTLTASDHPVFTLITSDHPVFTLAPEIISTSRAVYPMSLLWSCVRLLCLVVFTRFRTTPQVSAPASLWPVVRPMC